MGAREAEQAWSRSYRIGSFNAIKHAAQRQGRAHRAGVREALRWVAAAHQSRQFGVKAEFRLNCFDVISSSFCTCCNVISIQDPYPSLSFSPRNAAFGSKTVNSVTFNGTGRENSTDGVAFVITSSALSTLPARCVILDPSGRPSVRVDKDNDTSDGCN